MCDELESPPAYINAVWLMVSVHGADGKLLGLTHCNCEIDKGILKASYPIQFTPQKNVKVVGLAALHPMSGRMLYANWVGAALPVKKGTTLELDEIIFSPVAKQEKLD